MTTQKPIFKEKDVVPTAWHVTNPDYIGYISIGAERVYTEVYKTRKEAKEAVEELADTLNYDDIETVEDEGCYPERARIMEERYKESGRDAADHPMHGLFTGLAKEYGEISNDNPS
tara:strand:+ start:820 stop:1167 length:348 start_codon:yes stop_codon:yes gene_type:complete